MTVAVDQISGPIRTGAFTRFAQTFARLAGRPGTVIIARIGVDLRRPSVSFQQNLAFNALGPNWITARTRETSSSPDLLPKTVTAPRSSGGG